MQPHASEQKIETSEVSAGSKRILLTPMVRRVLWATAIAAIVTIGIGSIYAYISNHSNTSPNFQAVLPGDKSINQLGGWTRVNPPGQASAFSYSDTLDYVKINVSEQQLPHASQTVADIAKGYNATEKITANKTTVYIGTSFKGPQSVIFVKDGLLILIGSASKISNDSWMNYIQSLN